MKTLVVASGKGGTGKTTLSAVLVRVAAQSRAVVIADCDVEASNLPLALQADVITRSPFEGKPRTVVDEEACQGCGICIETCRFGAMALSGDGVAEIDPWLCESCGACARVCPADAIGFAPRQAGEILDGESPSGPILFARLRPGEDLSGRLVTSVRERADGIARARDAAFAVVDGPPGIGCPVIASVTGADGVLVVAEPSLSGGHDLRRLVELTRQMRIPVKVVLNKADLSLAGAERIRAACRDLGLDLIGEVAFDADLPSALEAVACGEAQPSSLGALRSVQSLHTIWSQLERWVDGWE